MTCGEPARRTDNICTYRNIGARDVGNVSSSVGNVQSPVRFDLRDSGSLGSNVVRDSGSASSNVVRDLGSGLSGSNAVRDSGSSESRVFRGTACDLEID